MLHLIVRAFLKKAVNTRENYPMCIAEVITITIERKIFREKVLKIKTS
jgi:uncharacterized protein YceH (UPF0502 family)